MKKTRSSGQPYIFTRWPEKRGPDRSDRLIPMINIVFLLLSFFMVAGTFRATDVLKVAPPHATAEAPLMKSDWVLALDREGKAALNGRKMPLPEVITLLKKEQQKTPELHLQLKADGEAEAGVVLTLFKQLSDMGIAKLDIVVVRDRTTP